MTDQLIPAIAMRVYYSKWGILIYDPYNRDAFPLWFWFSAERSAKCRTDKLPA